MAESQGKRKREKGWDEEGDEQQGSKEKQEEEGKARRTLIIVDL